MIDRETAARTLAACVERVGLVLEPWGFQYEGTGCHSSHRGPYAGGQFVRQTTRISLACRDTLAGLYYKESFITQHPSWREIESFTIGHNALMGALGHAADCQLAGDEALSDVVVRRDDGDRVAAWIHDLTTFAAPVLAAPTDEFRNLMRQNGRRSYTVE